MELEYLIELFNSNKVSYNEDVIEKITDLYDIITQKIEQNIDKQLKFKNSDYIQLGNYVIDNYQRGTQVRHFVNVDSYLSGEKSSVLKSLYPYDYRYGLVINTLLNLDIKNNNKAKDLTQFYEELLKTKKLIDKFMDKAEEKGVICEL